MNVWGYFYLVLCTVLLFLLILHTTVSAETAGAFYETAVFGAVENGITRGTSDTTFSPNNTCTRGESVTFLFRAYNLK